MDFLWECRLATDQSTGFLNANVLIVTFFSESVHDKAGLNAKCYSQTAPKSLEF